ncbi:MAG: glycosyltransferase family 2 protein [Candidatus Omnitrophica bacterium]|nr:glycosyltransferase family 2 protein [Candidatus Omnitrophota bacterium]
MKSISVIMPVYNEEPLLEESVSYIYKFLKTHFSDYEIIIIESGSTDRSSEKCDKLAKDFPKINVIHEGARNGFGSAFKLGCKKATKDLVWLITADLPFSLEHIFEALPLLDRYDCVLSFRSEDKRCLYRKVRSLFYNSLIKLILGLDVRHVNSTFKVFKRRLIQNMDLVSSGWFIDAEIIYRLKASKINYAEVPVPLIDRSKGKSSVGLFAPISLLKELAGFLRQRRGIFKENHKCI